jgi:hypothetical protein
MKNLNKYIFAILFYGLFYSCNDIFEPSPPKAPVINSIGARTINSIDLLWSKYDGGDFDRYEVYYKMQYAQDFLLYTTIKNERQIYLTVSGLEPNTAYLFYINTIDKSGNSTKSSVCQYETLSDVPSATTLYNVPDSNIQYSSIYLNWSQYNDEYAVPFSRYEIFCSKASNFPNTSVTKKIIINSRYANVVVNDLTELTTYYFKVRTYNSLEKYSESAVVSVRTTPCPPDLVGLHEAFDVTESHAKIIWTKSLDTAFQKYEIHISNSMASYPDSSNLFDVITSQNQTEYEINNLVKYKEYFVKILVYKNNNTHSTSNEIGFTAYPGGGPVPVEILDLPDESIGQTFINLNWTKSLSMYFEKYEVYMSTTPGFIPDVPNLRALILYSDRTTYRVSNLKKNTTYYFKILVYTKMVRYVYSQEKAFTTKP